MASAEEHKDRGNAHFKNKEYELAVEAYSQAISLEPKESTYWLNRCTTYRQLQQWEKAEGDAATAMELDPLNVKAWYGRSLCLMHLGRLQEALADCEAGLEMHSSNKALQQLRADLLRELGSAGSKPAAAQRAPSSSSSSSSSSKEQQEAKPKVAEEDIPCQQLCEFAAQGDVDACRRLLESGTVRDVNWRRPGDRNTALHLASEEGHVLVVKVLLAAGADPEAVNDFFLTPFALAEHGSEIERTLRELTKPLGEERRAALKVG